MRLEVFSDDQLVKFDEKVHSEKYDFKSVNSKEIRKLTPLTSTGDIVLSRDQIKVSVTQE